MFTPIRNDSSSYIWLQRFVDLSMPFILLYSITTILNIKWDDQYIIIGALGGLFFSISSQFIGTYEAWRGRSLFAGAKIIMKAWIITWASLVVFAFLLKESSEYSRLILLIWMVVTPVTLIIYRIMLRVTLGKYRQASRNLRTIAIVGAGDLGQRVANIINNNVWLGYEIIAFFDDNSKLHNSKISSVPVVDSIDKINDYINRNKYDEIYICLPLKEEEKIKHLLNKLTNTTVAVKYVPDFFTFDLMHAKWIDLQGIPIISVFDSPLNTRSAKSLKRIEDFILSSIILLLISPLMIAIAIGVKLTSPGQIFYRQTRVSMNGKKFEMLKFRSMPTNTEQDCDIQWGNSKKKTNTRFGQFIRATSLDELPQFFNVLKGDMSIVGPRPERDIFVEKFRAEIPKYMQKHMVKAGITGWAQINGWRGDTSLEKRIEFDMYYINHWSIWMDIKIIFLTIFKGFINKNAY